MREPRVSDEQIAKDFEHAKLCRLRIDETFLMQAGYPADLRDARAELATLRAKLAEAEREKERLEEANCGLRQTIDRSSGHAAFWQREKENILAAKNVVHARADRAEAALAQAEKVTEAMISAGVQAYATEINSKRSLSVHRLLKIALEAALNARKEG